MCSTSGHAATGAGARQAGRGCRSPPSFPYSAPHAHGEVRHNHFALPAAERFLLSQLLCEPAGRRDWRFITELGEMRTSSARTQLNTILQLAAGRDAAGYLGDLCGTDERAQALEKVAGWDGADILARVVDALAYRHDEADLPRFAGWAMHADGSVRRNALAALGSYPQAAAGRAVQASVTAYPEDLGAGLKALRRQGVVDNEGFLLQLLTAGDARHRSDVLGALGTSGTDAALAQLVPLLGERSSRPAAASAIEKIGVRGGLERERVLAAIDTLPPAAAAGAE